MRYRLWRVRGKKKVDVIRGANGIRYESWPRRLFNEIFSGPVPNRFFLRLARYRFSNGTHIFVPSEVRYRAKLEKKNLTKMLILRTLNIKHIIRRRYI